MKTNLHPLDTTPVWDYRHPFLLCDEHRLKWANDHRAQMGEQTEWRLGDHCWYRPVEWPA